MLNNFVQLEIKREREDKEEKMFSRRSYDTVHCKRIYGRCNEIVSWTRNFTF